MENNLAIKITNLTKKISNKTIIDDLSLDIYKGQVLGFLGPNGAGKTTTIRMIVGLISMSSGEVLIGGNSIKTDFKKAIKDVGAIVENPEFYKFLSGYKNLLHFAKMYDNVSKERIDEVIKMVNLQESIHEKVKGYSLGMRQRLGIALAMLHNPSVLILDEPTNGLDPEGIAEMRTYLKDLAHNENVAVLVSSHLLSEMQLMCDRVAIIKKGKLLAIKNSNEFDNLEKEFLKIVGGVN
ncbi:ABC transporter ATP-binding protein [Clostridium oceanicum]|uniref:ABC transporter domain-containing protein n=1 Tax=Clostridium oceanicum TaxID=1543 RepID=A0ABP3UMK6_9CLOT